MATQNLYFASRPMERGTARSLFITKYIELTRFTKELTQLKLCRHCMLASVQLW